MPVRIREATREWVYAKLGCTNSLRTHQSKKKKLNTLRRSSRIVLFVNDDSLLLQLLVWDVLRQLLDQEYEGIELHA